MNECFVCFFAVSCVRNAHRCINGTVAVGVWTAGVGAIPKHHSGLFMVCCYPVKARLDAARPGPSAAKRDEGEDWRGHLGVSRVDRPTNSPSLALTTRQHTHTHTCTRGGDFVFIY